MEHYKFELILFVLILTIAFAVYVFKRLLEYEKGLYDLYSKSQYDLKVTSHYILEHQCAKAIDEERYEDAKQLSESIMALEADIEIHKKLLNEKTI